jgi:hypothetical protein
MPKYRVFQVQEEVVLRKSHYVVDADDEDAAIEIAMNGAAQSTEHGTIREPEYATWGWSARPVDTGEDDDAWKEALTDLETRKLDT